MSLQNLFTFGAQKEKTCDHNEDDFKVSQFVTEHLVNEANQCKMNRAVQPRSNLSPVLQIDHLFAHCTRNDVAIICVAMLSKQKF